MERPSVESTPGKFKEQQGSQDGWKFCSQREDGDQARVLEMRQVMEPGWPSTLAFALSERGSSRKSNII